MAQILDGKACARTVRAAIRREVAALRTACGDTPHVAFVQVGDIPASTSYVNSKSSAAEKVGMSSTIVRIAASVSQNELLTAIEALNADSDIHGILVQLPLPPHIDPLVVALAIDPAKDVDCFHPSNVGQMTLGLPGPRPATPQGIMMLLDHFGIDPAGRQAVVVGRSNLVGKPMGVLLLARDATVTWCHSATVDLAEHTRRADILVCAAGRAGLITADMIRPGAVVVDVSTNYVPSTAQLPASETIHIRGQRDTLEGVDPDRLPQTELRLVGDVDFDGVANVADWVSPVPGGVGPMTIASVLWNGLTLFKQALGRAG